MHYSVVLERHPNREIRIGIRAQQTRKRSGEDSDSQRAETRYHEAIARLELIRKWHENGGYHEHLPTGRLVPVRYTSEQYESDRASLLDIINQFQHHSYTRTTTLTSPAFQPPVENHPPEQLDLFKYAAGVHPLPEIDRPSGRVVNFPVRRRKQAVGFCDLRTVNRVRQFGSRQRRALIRTGAVMSNVYPHKGETYEVTLTLPGSTKAALKCLAANTGYLCNRLLQVVRRYEKKSGEAISWFYVWEWQKRGALHLHMAIGSKDKQLAKNVADSLEYMWFELLLELKDRTGIDLFARPNGTWRDKPEYWQSHVAEIEKSLAAYFAKYASKDKDSGHNKVKYYPVTWWGSSLDLKRELKAQTTQLALNYLTEDEATEWYVRLDQILGAYKSLKGYAYDYQIEGKSKDSNERRLFAFGETRISYYDDEVFSQLGDEVNTLAVWMRAEARNSEWTGQLPSVVNESFRVSAA